MKKIFKIKFLAILHYLFLNFYLNINIVHSKEIENKTYIIATEATYAPFVYMNPKGEIVGIDIDIIKSIFKNLKYKYKIIHRPFETLFLGLQSNKYDLVIGGITYNEERSKKASFSESYYTDFLSLVYHKNLNLKFDKNNLKNKKIGVQLGTVFENYLEKKFNKIVNIISYSGNNEAFLDLENNRLDAVLADNSTILYWIKNLKSSKKKEYKTIYIKDKNYLSKMVIAFNKSNNELLLKVNESLKKLKKNLSLKKIIDKYLENQISLKNPNYYKFILEGIPITILIASLSLILGIILTILFTVIQQLNIKSLNNFLNFFLTILRGIPEIIVLLFAFFLFPKIIKDILKYNIELSPMFIASFSLGIIFSSYATNIVSKEISNFPKEQISSAKVLGLKNLQIFKRIIFPQIFINILPSLNNLWLVLLKDTSIVALVGLSEVLSNTKLASNSTNTYFSYYLFAALIYLIITSFFNLIFYVISKIIKT